MSRLISAAGREMIAAGCPEGARGGFPAVCRRRVAGAGNKGCEIE
jgi:hypothetical protein